MTIRFYIQDEGDKSSATSDGIFIYLSDPTVSVGDEVVIQGTATEYYDQTEIIPTSDPVNNTPFREYYHVVERLMFGKSTHVNGMIK